MESFSTQKRRLVLLGGFQGGNGFRFASNRPANADGERGEVRVTLIQTGWRPFRVCQRGCQRMRDE